MSLPFEGSTFVLFTIVLFTIEISISIGCSMDTLRVDLVGSLEEEADLVLESLVEDEVHRAAGYCVVGRFLTDQTINFTAMKNRITDIWKPVKGVTIRTLGNGRFMFEFYHPLDVSRVYDIPHGFVSERFGKLVGDFLGSFLEYDQTNDLGAWRTYMRVRVNIDTSLPLKRFKSIRMGEGGVFRITFKYEKLSTFCFVCGRVGHTENFCELKYAANGGEVARGWDASLRAPKRRGMMGTGSRWLRGGAGQEMGSVVGDVKVTPTIPMQGGQGSGTKPVQGNEGNISKELIPFGGGSDEGRLMCVFHKNPVYEDSEADGFLDLEDGEQLDERKRKRGKKIMESDSVCSTVITNENFLEAGPSFGACPE
ncbi:hypothetical protein ACS0TY_032968 [Phlomoides rotata]